MTALLIALVVVLAVALAALACVQLTAPRATARASPVDRHAGGSCSRSSAARSRSARSTPRCGSRAPRTRRSCRSSSRACRCTFRSTRRCRASRGLRDPAAGGDRAARDARSACRSTRGSSAGAPTATRSGSTIAHERYRQDRDRGRRPGQPRLRPRRRRLAARPRARRDRRAAPEQGGPARPATTARSPARGGAGADQPPRTCDRRAHIETGPARPVPRQGIEPHYPWPNHRDSYRRPDRLGQRVDGGVPRRYLPCGRSVAASVGQLSPLNRQPDPQGPPNNDALC